MNIARTSVLFAPLLFATILTGQNPPPIQVGGVRTTADLLRHHHIDLSKESLVSALKDPDPQVRYLAAEKLSEDNARDAVPAITQALEDETVPATRINIAFALALLGDETGVAALRTACDTSSLPGSLRAAMYLLNLHTNSCPNAILNMLESESTLESRTEALSILPSFRHLTDDQLQRALKLAIRSLDDPTPAVRLDAAVVLGSLGSSSVIPSLQRAVAKEQNKLVREQMENTIVALHQKREQ
jgi:HEAT repeat protein